MPPGDPWRAPPGEFLLKMSALGWDDLPEVHDDLPGYLLQRGPQDPGMARGMGVKEYVVSIGYTERASLSGPR